MKRVKAVPQERQRQNTNDKVNTIIIANQGVFCILTKRFFLTLQRISSEVGDCVTNPAKSEVIDMESQGRLHLTDPVSKFCTSYVLVNMCDVELERFIDAWNNHSISGSGIARTYPLS